jgi:hypothetical protein
MGLGENILNILATTFSNDISISKLAFLLKQNGFDGDYKNTYQKIRLLEKQGFISTQLIGKSRIIKINYSNTITISKLAMIELSKKINFIKKNPLFKIINTQLNLIPCNTLILINAQKNFLLNRLELLIITDQPKSSIAYCEKIEKQFKIRLDCLTLTESQFEKLMLTNNQIIIQMLQNRIIFSNQEQFFNILKKLIPNIGAKNYSLLDLNENEIRYNLTKFGYSEFGKETSKRELSIEETIIATLINGTARQKLALKTIIKTNDFDSELLSFLLKKYSKQKEFKKFVGEKQ